MGNDEMKTMDTLTGNQHDDEPTPRSSTETVVHSMAQMMQSTKKTRLRIKKLPDRPAGLIQGN